MSLNFFQRRKILKNANFLELTPIRNRDYDFTEEGKVYIVVPKFDKQWMRNFFISGRRRKNVSVYLDDLGSHTWLEIDGNKNVGEICDILKNKLGKKLEPLEEVEDRVTKFLSMLYQQRYIWFRELEQN